MSSTTTSSTLDHRNLVGGLAPQLSLELAKEGLRRGDEGARMAAFYLAELVDTRGYLVLGYRSVRRLLEKGTRHSVRHGKALIKIGRALRQLPEIDRRFAEGRLTKSHVELLARVAVPETEVEWAEEAEKLSVRQLEKKVKGRQKGDRPTDDAQRRIHDPRPRIRPVLTSTEYLEWQRTREKFEAESGRPVSDGEMAVELSRMYRQMSPDGSLPGWRRVNTRHFLLHGWPRETPEGGLEFVTTDEDGDVVPIDLVSLVRSLPRRPVGAGVALPPNLIDLSTVDPENHERVVPMAQRDVPTPADMREKVLERDGYQCRSCASRDNLTVHHRVWRSYGGRTVEANLVSLCEVCHSLVHARFLVVLGDPAGELRFLDYRGRPRGGDPLIPTAARTAAAPDASSAFAASAVPANVMVDGSATFGAPPSERPTLVELDRLPGEVDANWWRRHEDLLAWSERQGELVLTPGYAQDRDPTESAPPAEAVSGAAGDGLASLVGQASVRERLELAISAARLRGEQLGHLLFTGPPGLGKTSLARAVAVELGAPISILPAPHVRTPDMLVRALAGLSCGSVLFLDEVHGLPGRVAEVLYGAMDSGVLSVPVRQGVRVRALRVKVQPFTLIGATTDPFQLPRPLQSRFRELKLEFYGPGELAEIVTRAASARGFVLTPEGAERLAAASRETPRRALKLLDAVRDEASVARTEVVGVAMVERALAREEVDLAGLDRVERAYVRVLEDASGPVGLRTIAALLGLSEAQLETAHEPELLRRGFVQITPAGRVLGRGRRVEVALEVNGRSSPSAAAG